MHRESPESSSQTKWLAGGKTPLFTLIALSVFLGGTPNTDNWKVFVLCLLSAIVLAVSISTRGFKHFSQLPILARIAVLGAVALVFLQLVLLPPNIWQNMSGRELTREVLEHVSASEDWRPLSLAPSKTLFGALMLLPPLAAFFGSLNLSPEDRIQAVWILVSAVAVSVLVGLIQFGSGGSALNFYDTSHNGSLLGFFANRNHQGLLLAIGAAFTLTLCRRRIESFATSFSVSIILAIAFFIAAIGTLSRAGISLTLFSASLTIYIFYIHRKLKPLHALAVFIIFASGLYFVSFSVTVQRALERFSQISENGRFEIWQDSLPLVSQYFPWGSGLGTFTTVYPTIEKLEDVNPLFLNRAHNDYLEWAIEFGALGVLLVAIFGLALLGRTIAIARSELLHRSFFAPSVISVLLVGLHSIVDYPLRTQSHAVVFAFACALLFSRHTKGRARQSDPTDPKQYALGIGTGLVAAASVIFVFYVSVSGRVVLPTELAMLQPQGSQQLRASDAQIESAEKLLIRDPLNQTALNFIFVSRVKDGMGADGKLKFVQTLGKLGWRRTAVQQNLLLESLEKEEVDPALDHIDALLRREKLTSQILPILSAIERIPEGTPLLAERLANMPNWRSDYFLYLDGLSDYEGAVARLRLFSLMNDRGLDVDRAEMGPSLLRILEAGNREELAQFVQSNLVVLTDQSLLFDPDFQKMSELDENDRARPLPHDWRLTNRSGITTQISASEDMRQLLIRWDGRGAPVFARAMTFLRQGQQPSLKVTFGPSTSMSAAESLRFSLSCEGGVEDVQLVSSIDLGSEEAESSGAPNAIELFASDSIPCNFPDLSVGGRPKLRDERVEISLDAVELQLPVG